MRKAQIIVFGTGGCLHGLTISNVAAGFSSSNTQCLFCFISAIKVPAQTLQADFWALFYLYLHSNLRTPFPPSPPTGVSISDTVSLLKFLYYGRQAATIDKEALKHSEMIYFLCEFHSYAHNPWLVILA